MVEVAREKPLRVLIAEDEALIRLDLKEMLEEEGYAVVGEAADGRARSSSPSSCVPIWSSWTSRCRFSTGCRQPPRSLGRGSRRW
ncbi:MAG: hypothetical protein WKF47_10590 [Geodermatophilaceae bacterium]